MGLFGRHGWDGEPVNKLVCDIGGVHGSVGQYVDCGITSMKVIQANIRSISSIPNVAQQVLLAGCSLPFLMLLLAQLE